MTEEKFRELFASTGWKVKYRRLKSDSPARKGRVSLTSKSARIDVGTTYRKLDEDRDDASFRKAVFENAARDLTGEYRDAGYWAVPCFSSLDRETPLDSSWFKSGLNCLTPSVEEFALKLATCMVEENA